MKVSKTKSGLILPVKAQNQIKEDKIKEETKYEPLEFQDKDARKEVYEHLMKLANLCECRGIYFDKRERKEYENICSQRKVLVDMVGRLFLGKSFDGYEIYC